MSKGIVLTVAGLWVILQVTKGGLVARLGL